MLSPAASIARLLTTINLVLGQNGIIGKANQAKTITPQKEAEEAEQEIVEARRKILHASDTLRQIYNECYDD